MKVGRCNAVTQKQQTNMKTKAVFAALLLMIGVVTVKAGERGPSLTISHKDGSSIFLVNYRAAQKGDVKISVKDQLGRVLISESVKSVSAFSIPVNLKDVDAGVYDIEVDNGNDKQVHILDYSLETPSTYAHVTSLGNKKYLLSVEHPGTEKINVRILDDSGSLVFEQAQLIEGNFARVYNVKHSFGAPSFEVTDEEGRVLATK